MKGKINVYTCESCGSRIVTVDRHEGTTPFMIACEREGCLGYAQSSFYRNPERLTPTKEWFRPSFFHRLCLRGAGQRDHVRRGGLLLRPISIK